MLSEEGKEVKRKLEQLNHEKRQLQNLQAELLRWRNEDGLKSASLEAPVMGGEKKFFSEKRVLKIEELQEKISASIDLVISLEDEFLDEIETLDPLSQNLLFERYMTGKPLKKIVHESSFSDRHIRRIYANAYEKISEKTRER